MRENYVLTKGDVVVGFVSVYFQNDRNTAVKFAFRIGKEWRGDGYGRMTTSLLNRRLTHTYPQLGSIISAIPDVDLTEDQMRSHKFGNLLTVKAISVYKFRCDQLTLKEPQARLDTLSKTEFAEALRECRLQHLLENNILHLNWVPVRAQTEQDVEFAVRKKQTVMVEGAGSVTSLRQKCLNISFVTSECLKVKLNIPHKGRI